MSGVILQKIEKCKCLGITLDQQLSFREHIEVLLSKLKLIIPMLAKLENSGVPRNQTLSVYKALFIPYITYGLVLFGRTYTTLIGKLQVAQNNAVRAMLGYRKDENVTELYAKHQLLNIKHLYKYEFNSIQFNVALFENKGAVMTNH